MWTRHASRWLDRGGLSARWMTVSTSFSMTPRTEVVGGSHGPATPRRAGNAGTPPSYTGATGSIEHRGQNASPPPQVADGPTVRRDSRGPKRSRGGRVVRPRPPRFGNEVAGRSVPGPDNVQLHRRRLVQVHQDR